MAFSQLPEDAQVLLRVLTFFNTNHIDESLLKESILQVESPNQLKLAKHRIDFSNAEKSLLQMSFINKSIDNGTITMDKSVQEEVIDCTTSEERREIFSIVVHIMMVNLPDTYSADVGHQFTSWSKCERLLPHIESILEQNSKYCILHGANQEFAQLLLRSSWYLYEREDYSTASSHVELALVLFSSQTSLAFASAIDLRGLIDLDISRPMTALEAFEEAYTIRKKILEPDDALLAASFVNIGLALTNLNIRDMARGYFQESIDLRLLHNSDRIGNSYSNMASLLLLMGKADETEKMLKRCPSLKDFTDETFFKTGNPRFSGDMVLLSRISLEQGRYDESLELASKALGFRKQCLGNRLKVCDSLYQVASIHERGNNLVLAIQHLGECIKISEALPQNEGQRHLARASYKLSKFFKTLGKEHESAELFDRAMALKDDIYKLDGAPSYGNTDFERLVPWMLW